MAAGACPTAPLLAPRRRARAAVDRAGVVAWLFWLYDVINNFAPLRQPLARHNANGLLSLERSLGIGLEHTLDHWLSGHTVVGSSRPTTTSSPTAW